MTRLHLTHVARIHCLELVSVYMYPSTCIHLYHLSPSIHVSCIGDKIVVTATCISICIRLHVDRYMKSDTSSKQWSTRGYKWIQLVPGLHVSGVNAALKKMCRAISNPPLGFTDVYRPPGCQERRCQPARWRNSQNATRYENKRHVTHSMTSLTWRNRVRLQHQQQQQSITGWTRAICVLPAVLARYSSSICFMKK